jgi:hypothetical protein
MRALSVFALSLTCLLIGGCDKVGELLGKGEIAKLAPTTPQPGGEVDPALAAQVQRHEDGVSFRRDLDFPGTVTGRLRVSRDHDGVRVVEKSELGSENTRWDHILETEVVYDKYPGRFTITLEKAGRRILPDQEENAAVPAGASDLEGESLGFVLTEDGWSVDGSASGEFRKVNWAQSMNSAIPRLLVETGAHPRAQWFSSSRRWKPGDRVVLTGSAIRMIQAADVSGRIELVFEGEEAIGGHPCGVFSVTGDLSVRSEVDFLGKERDAEISISEGRIWASLLYPVLMREEYQTVQTITAGSGGGLSTRLQGAIKVVKSRSWEPQKD